MAISVVKDDMMVMRRWTVGIGDEDGGEWRVETKDSFHAIQNTKLQCMLRNLKSI